VDRRDGSLLKLGLNIYSFNKPLRAGELTVPEVIDYCADNGYMGLDATGYYFPGYPSVPSDEYIYACKRKAFVNGVTISGTGVRNDFAVADEVARRKDFQLVKNWVEVCAKLGGTALRVFTGKKVPDGYTFDQALEWLAPLMRECVDYGRRYGVMVSMQNHNDFAKTAEESIRIIEAVDSEWFGLVLDVGSLRMHDPYEEIEKLLPYATSWQIKENVWYGRKEVPLDLPKLAGIIRKGGYRGFLPLETLGDGDPKQKLARFLPKVRAAFPEL
jgi:sugar phosphate isomerase/epimerase